MANNKLKSGLEIVKGHQLATNVWEARYMFQDLAVKEIANEEEALKEIEAYAQKGFGTNIIKLHGYSLKQQNIVQLVLDRAQCSLPQFFNLVWNREVNFMTPSKEEFKDKVSGFQMVNNGSPSPELLGLMSAILIAVESLWKKKLKHGFLEPENVMIFDDITAKLAMNQKIHHGRPPYVDVDLFGLGQIVHCFVSGGEHGYTNGAYCISSIIRRPDYADALDLIARLFNTNTRLQKLHNSKSVLHKPSNHPYFWDPLKRMHFYELASKKLAEFSPFNLNLSTEQQNQAWLQEQFFNSNKGKLHSHSSGDWKAALDKCNKTLWVVMTSIISNYNTAETKDLVRFIRNSYVHCDQDQINQIIGKTPTEIEKFYRGLFPYLLSGVHEVASIYWMDDEVFRKFVLDE